MKRLIFLILVFFSLLSASAQRTEDDYVGSDTPPEKSDVDRWRMRENLFFGGGFGLGFSNGLALNLNPNVGVKYKNFIGAGVGLDYQYFGVGGNNIQTIGPSVFTRAKAFNVLLLQAEYVHLFYKDTYFGDVISFDTPMFLVGGGYQSGDANGGMFVMLLWDLIQDPYNPLPMPVLRAGFSLGF